MTRSAEFGATVKQGTRVVQPDLVIHARHEVGIAGGPRVGFVVSKAVGNAVERHRVSRRLRHAARTVIADLDPADMVVIRALPGSRHAASPRLEQEITAGVRRALAMMGGGDR
jgi:ribonuclease P protein component